MRQKILFGLCVACMPLTAIVAQDKKSLTLDGRLNVNKGSASFRYQLVFNENGGRISGYSLTWLTGVNPNKCKVEGSIDKDKGVIHFKEVASKNDSANMCYLESDLKYTIKGKEITATGPFKGHDEKNKMCGEGNMTLTHTLVRDSVFVKDSSRRISISAAGDLLGKKVANTPLPPLKVEKKVVENPNGSPTAKDHPKVTNFTVSADGPLNLDWATDTLYLWVWDYGKPDGDRITLIFNGMMMLDEYEITGKKRLFKFPITRDENRIEVKAINEGRVPPNTARLLLECKSAQYNITSVNGQGKSSIININKAK